MHSIFQGKELQDEAEVISRLRVRVRAQAARGEERLVEGMYYLSTSRLATYWYIPKGIPFGIAKGRESTYIEDTGDNPTHNRGVHPRLRRLLSCPMPSASPPARSSSPYRYGMWRCPRLGVHLPANRPFFLTVRRRRHPMDQRHHPEGRHARGPGSSEGRARGAALLGGGHRMRTRA